MSSSALPAWLQEILPPFLAQRPALTGAVYATMQSASLGMGIMLSIAAQQGAFSSFSSTVSWFAGNWWGLTAAAIVAGYRGQQAATKALVPKGPNP